MTIAKKIFSLLVVITFCRQTTRAQNIVAVSSNPGPGIHVALNWAPFPGATRYHVYRKNEGAPSYPSAPLNGAGTPIQVMSSCPAIRTLLITSPDSTDWKIVAKALSGPGLFNPCNVNTLAVGSEKHKRLQVIAKASMPIAMVAGLGYRDNTVVNGTSYRYRVVALNNANTTVGTVGTDLLVTAGAFVPLPAPATVITEPGDDAVLVRWDDVTGAAGFMVERATAAVGPYQRVSESHFTAEIRNHLNGDTLIPAWNGMVDFKRFTKLQGKDSTHLVNGIAIPGPKNNTNYFYRVSALDLFMRPGALSAVSGPVIPRDSTAPSVPIDIMATPDEATGHVTIRWTQVAKDEKGHWEYPDSTVKYRLYRFPSSENPNTTPSVFLTEQPTIKGLQSRDFKDTDPTLRSAFGNKKWWYRLRSIDVSTNMSQWSTAVSAIVKDITPPSIVKNVQTMGLEDRISVKWQPNPEPDMASYMIYRSLCHLGSWIDCSKQKDCREWQNYDPNKGDPKNPDKPTSPNDGPNNPSGAPTTPKSRLPCPCSGPFVFLGEITKDSVSRAITAGNFFFDDKTIPPGSPLCYAYWIKAKDSSDNISGTFPIPSPDEVAQIKCERLRDRTPPEHAIISGLYAQAEQIRIEWIGPPTQDTRAYHVYRAEGTNPSAEPASGAYTWVGGMTVELPPALPVPLPAPYTPPGMATCDKISVQATEWMSHGFFEDKTIQPKLTYWYKVVGIDYDGNETPLDRAAAISTFSFTKKVPDAPVIDVIDKQSTPCAVTLKWSPPYNAGLHAGFIVYRSLAAAGPFTPVVVAPVKGNSFTDINVVKGQTYWYSVAVMMLNGRLSVLSVSKSMTP